MNHEFVSRHTYKKYIICTYERANGDNFSVIYWGDKYPDDDKNEFASLSDAQKWIDEHN